MSTELPEQGGREDLATADLAPLSTMVEEVSASYARQFGIERDDAWFVLKLQEEVGELTQAFLAMSGRSRDRGRSGPQLRAQFAEEVADVLCHVLLLARHQGVDLGAEVEAKWLARRPVERPLTTPGSDRPT